MLNILLNKLFLLLKKIIKYSKKKLKLIIFKLTKIYKKVFIN